MDVVCDRCKTEYEFDDALVSERGTTVKCTNCSHQFKIFRPPSEADGGRAWTLRRPDGTVIPFDSLAVLQKWILEGRVSKMDEIARSGDAWKSLGAIAELETFFAGAESRGTPASARPVASRPPNRSLPPLRSNPPLNSAGVKSNAPRVPPPPAASPSQRPPAPPAQAILKGTAPMSRTFGGTSPGMPPPAGLSPTHESSAQRLPAAHRTPLPAPLPALPPPEVVAVEQGRSATASSDPAGATSVSTSRLLEPPVRAEVSDDDIPTRSLSVEDPLVRSEPRRAPRWLGAAVGLAAVGALAAVIWRVSSSRGEVATTRAPTAASDLAEVHRLMETYSRAALEDARDALTRRLGAHPEDPAALAARAQALALAAEFARASADDQERAAPEGANGAEQRALAVVLRADAARSAERALTDFNAARRAMQATSDPAIRAEAELSLLDAARALRQSGEVEGLARAVEARAPRSDRASLVLALVRLDRADGSEGLNALRAIAGGGTSPRARVVLARALVNRGDLVGAREQLAALGGARGSSDDLAALRAAVALVDAGPRPAPAATPTVVARAAVADASANVAQGPDVSPIARAAAPTRDYDRLVSEGDRLQNEGRTAAAEERFRAALAARPGGAEALTGMGYVELDRRNYSGAIARFRQALASNGSFSDAYIGMGEAYASQSRYEQALEAYQRYISVNPGGSRASMARRQIESLLERVRRPAEEPPAAPPSGEPGG